MRISDGSSDVCSSDLQIVNGVDCGLHLLVAEHNAAQHDFFGQVLSFGFNHQHSRFGTGHDQIHLRCLELAGGGVKHILTVDVADSCSTDGAVERKIGRASCRESVCQYG